MNLLDVGIVTNRLVLKPISMEYKDNTFLEFTEEITTYMCPQSPREISETEAFIQEGITQLKIGSDLRVVILKKETQEFLGCAGIHNIKQQHPELGIWLKKAAHGNKYGLEVITALKDWTDTNIIYEYLSYPVDRRNIASRKIPEALGGQISREYEYIQIDGNTLYLLEYRIYSSS
ncbi:GNAT family N-acetyltransferase [Chroogloeocystis siderophila]|uniref:GNAT family N-acetyltransferase n=1 Tax=Chroogloeocystis siderophila 5.2 s.c.1 TaxID=247279 RepID=A0A1U7HVJ8_9CHRO|nr:GNAT family N-acetyltransferase [Chroogloeocystis siderophila]OKH27597.1 GNAT family N-acetyltransferase [Chroogloeocystis siderophila 5.2 s.c.1]